MQYPLRIILPAVIWNLIGTCVVISDGQSCHFSGIICTSGPQTVSSVTYLEGNGACAAELMAEEGARFQIAKVRPCHDWQSWYSHLILKSIERVAVTNLDYSRSTIWLKNLHFQSYIFLSVELGTSPRWVCSCFLTADARNGLQA